MHILFFFLLLCSSSHSLFSWSWNPLSSPQKQEVQIPLSVACKNPERLEKNQRILEQEFIQIDHALVIAMQQYIAYRSEGGIKKPVVISDLPEGSLLRGTIEKINEGFLQSNEAFLNFPRESNFSFLLQVNRVNSQYQPEYADLQICVCKDCELHMQERVSIQDFYAAINDAILRYDSEKALFIITELECYLPVDNPWKQRFAEYKQVLQESKRSPASDPSPKRLESIKDFVAQRIVRGGLDDPFAKKD